MLLTVLEITVNFVQRLAIAFLVIFAIIAAGAACRGQVIIFAGEPSLAPPDCYCGVSCKCEKCECNVKGKPPEVSVKKAYTPVDASVVVHNKLGKDVFRCSGTAICDSTVVTCWHFIRNGIGDVTVNGIPAKVLKFDSKSDVALLKVEGQLKPVNVASEPLRAGAGCTAYGYEWNRNGLWKFPTRINQLNRYSGFSNQSIYGRPASGRSGGGLFNAKGELIGVCSAADGNEGLYCGLAAIQNLIDIPAPPLTVAPRQQAISGPVFNSNEWTKDPACTTGQCPLIKKASKPAQSPAVPARRR